MKTCEVVKNVDSSKLTYRQRLALQVGRAVGSLESGVSFPYGFERYASVAAKCIGRKLQQGYDLESSWY
jgi:hypothetical protein